jgi:hypothetical protein
MTGSESYLLDAGWLFFAGWSLVVVTISVIAFGKDLALLPLLYENDRHESITAETRHSAGGTRL